MASPITWRNVEAPDLRGAAAMLGQAQASLNSGFGHINDVLKNERATADANWSQIRDNNTQTFLDSIAQYRTAEDFQAAQQAGALDQLRSQFGPQIDRAAVRAAEDGRLATLQGRDVQAINYGNTMTDAKEDPIKRTAMAALFSGDKDTYNRIVAENPNARFLPEVMDKNRNVTQQNTEWERDGIKFTRDGEKHSSEMLTDRARRGLIGAQTSHANAAASRERSEGSSATAALKAELAAAKAQKGAAELFLKNGPYDGGHLGNVEGQKTFYDALGKMGLDPTQVEDIGQVISSKYFGGAVMKNGEKIPVPVSAALQAVRAAHEKERFRNFFGSTSQGDRVDTKLQEILADPTFNDDIRASLQAQGIQYRPLTQSAQSNSGYAPTVEGASLVQKTINDRIAKAQKMMTPAELKTAQTTGVVPSRVQRILLDEDEEQ